MSETLEEEEARNPWPPRSNKSPEMEAYLDRLVGHDRRVHCATCASTKIGYDDFRDALSRKEYGISRMCQACQDSVFGQTEWEGQS